MKAFEFKTREGQTVSLNAQKVRGAQYIGAEKNTNEIQLMLNPNHDIDTVALKAALSSYCVKDAAVFFDVDAAVIKVLEQTESLEILLARLFELGRAIEKIETDLARAGDLIRPFFPDSALKDESVRLAALNAIVEQSKQSLHGYIERLDQKAQEKAEKSE